MRPQGTTNVNERSWKANVLGAGAGDVTGSRHNFELWDVRLGAEIVGGAKVQALISKVSDRTTSQHISVEQIAQIDVLGQSGTRGIPMLTVQ